MLLRQQEMLCQEILEDGIFEGSLDTSYEDDEEWSTPVTKISRLSPGHESWINAHEILEAPSALCRKVGDEARSIAARHIIDRLKEKQLLNEIGNVAPRLRSAVELLSKPDADHVYPPFQFVVNEMRNKYPNIYTSVIANIDLNIPADLKPSPILVSLAKNTLENSKGEIETNWGKFVALLALCGSLAIDSVESGYPEGVAELVETFGILVEQVMGEWILSDKPGEGGGWDGFISLNVYEAIMPPVPRTFVILFLGFFFIYILYVIFSSIYFSIFHIDDDSAFVQKCLTVYQPICSRQFGVDLSNNVCTKSSNLWQYLCSISLERVLDNAFLMK